MAPDITHRYWFAVHQPDIGVRNEQGWCFGADALLAARNAVQSLRERNKAAEYLLPGDVHVTHDGACSCLPPELRRY